MTVKKRGPTVRIEELRINLTLTRFFLDEEFFTFLLGFDF